MRSSLIINGWLLLCGGILLGSCNQNKKTIEQAATPQTALTSKPTLVYRPTGPDPAVADLLPISGDTLIAVKNYGGLTVTTDAGRHWKGQNDQRQNPDFLFIKDLTIDQHHVLWGLDSWPGIHEAPYSRLSHSTDFGKTWTQQQFNPTTFFPYTIYSSPGQALQIVTYDGNVCQIQDQIGRKWKYVKTISELNQRVNDTIYDDGYVAGARFKFLKTGQVFSRSSKGWKPVATAGFINWVDDVCSCQGSTYITGRNSAAAPPNNYLIRAANGRVQDTIRIQQEQLRLRCDSKGRLWLFNFRGIWEKSGKSILKRY
ncbi:hypothetical protein DNI29_22030 [Hymenobacter sediminis]|uniref:WD40/YVTN/BNR-like repeat-containing protein n=1 Tax=Hymenobacter sediminis TaxID=2218621 RepID=UPI000F4E0F48|nr:hypothetical protein [Hymenobacter sediminis]RPD44385.1 hypothetical protein DNI29_22030 [Hymenobacter sediminis]